MFVESIFYVGKGKNSRSTQHLKDARDSDKHNKVGDLFTTTNGCGFPCLSTIIGWQGKLQLPENNEFFSARYRRN